jgi:phage gp29-like protein
VSIRSFFARHRAAGNRPAAGASLRELVSSADRYREQYNPLRALTISRAVTLLEEAQRGEFADVMWLYRFIEMTNPTLLALVERRESALMEMDYDVKIAAEEKHPATWDEQLAEDQRATLAAAYEQVDNLYQAIAHIATATFRSYAHAQMHLDAGETIRHIEPLDQWNFLRDGLYGDWYWNPGAASRSTHALSAEQRLDPERDLLIIRQRSRHVDRPGLIMYIRENLCEKDWDGFVEIYGIPSPVVIGPPDVPAEKEDA